MRFEQLVDVVSSANAAVRTDSRLVREGEVFVAVPGTARDGHDFIDGAIGSGAKYVVCQEGRRVRSNGTEVVFVKDCAAAAGNLAQASYGNPSQQLTNLAVTGTNGKTTVAFLVQSCIQAAGLKCGLVGTVVYDTCSGQRVEAPLTTPDCLKVAELSREMVDNGATYMVTEASSHALSQNRLAGIDFKGAAFTNLSGDHLDYHGTKEEYLAAKALLFKQLTHDGTAVLNKESQEARLIGRQVKKPILWYAIDEPAEIAAHVVSMDAGGTRFTLSADGSEAEVSLPLVGRYNVSNALAAAGLCLAGGIGFDEIVRGLSSAQAVPGRLEKVENNKGFSVLIDYAHTDDALRNVLAAVRPLCKGRLIVVFGCGGDRDRTKRSRMASAAEELADVVVVTSDNPRTEEPGVIIEEIMTGFENAQAETVTVEVDREKAIALAVREARDGDIVLIAGKGHETYQILGTEKIHFSDREVVEKHVEQL